MDTNTKKELKHQLPLENTFRANGPYSLSSEKPYCSDVKPISHQIPSNEGSSCSPPITTSSANTKQTMERCIDGRDEKTCRICLETDHTEQMIAPCQCKGGSRWVHRQCLDLWRTQEHDRAFAQCTECLSPYQLEPVLSADSARFQRCRRRVKFALLLSRDLCGFTLVSQLIIAFLGLLTWAADQNQTLPAVINLNSSIAVYYVFGLLEALFVLGMVGSWMLCRNEFSASAALAPYQRQPQDQVLSYQDPQRNTDYSQRRHSRDCCSSCHHYNYPAYQGDPGPCCFCCYYWCGEPGGSGIGSNSGCCCGCCRCCPDCDSTSNERRHVNRDFSCGRCCEACDCGSFDCSEALCCCLAFLAFLFVIWGFVVGMVVTSIILQRAIQRHIYILHKRQLVQEFQVVDLSEDDHNHDVEKQMQEEVPEMDTSETTGEEQEKPSSKRLSTVIRKQLSERDVAYLEKLGLMEKRN